MRIAAIFVGALVALPVMSQEPVVSKADLWSDTVKRGDMVRQVRGLGEVKDVQTVALRVAETKVTEVRVGQEVAVDTRNPPILKGKVTRVGSSASNGVVLVDVRLDAPLAPGLAPGLNVDGAVKIEMLSDVIYVGRPVFGKAGSEGRLFKIDPDGMHATSVKVRFGRESVNLIEVVEGLQPGDRVIVSDMSAHAGQSRIRLQ